MSNGIWSGTAAGACARASAPSRIAADTASDITTALRMVFPPDYCCREWVGADTREARDQIVGSRKTLLSRHAPDDACSCVHTSILLGAANSRHVQNGSASDYA